MKIKSKWFEKCLRDFLDKPNGELTEDDFARIKYLYVSTSDGYVLGFSEKSLPYPFNFSDCGDEWFCRCLSDTKNFNSVSDFLEIKKYGQIYALRLKNEVLNNQDNEEISNETLMQNFENSIKMYYPKDEDFEGLEENDDCEYGIIDEKDFALLKNLETIRLMSCQLEIHSISFIENLDKLDVLEIGEVRLKDLSGLERLAKLKKLCIWSN